MPLNESWPGIRGVVTVASLSGLGAKRALALALAGATDTGTGEDTSYDSALPVAQLV